MARALLTVLLALSCGLGPQPEAQTRIEAAIGLDPSKNGDTRTLRIALSGDWAQRWFRDGRWYLTPHWTLEAGHWESPDRGTSGVDRLSDIGVRLGVRMLRKGPWSNGLRPCLEASTGAHYLTPPASTTGNSPPGVSSEPQSAPGSDSVTAPSTSSAGASCTSPTPTSRSPTKASTSI